MDDPNKLKWKFIDDAGPFPVNPDSPVSKEISFGPSPGHPSDPLANAICKDDMIGLVEKGEPIIVETTVSTPGSTQNYRITPKSSLVVVQYLKLKGWVCAEMQPL